MPRRKMQSIPRSRREKTESTTPALPAADCCEKAGERRAVHADPVLKKANLDQLRRIEGQVRGIAGMIETERYCADIITQIEAARRSLHTVSRRLLRNHVRHCARAALTRGGKQADAMCDELVELVRQFTD